MIETTHVGSLPRGPELVPLLLARDKGEAYDAAEFDRVVQAAVDEGVRKQVEASLLVTGTIAIAEDGSVTAVDLDTPEKLPKGIAMFVVHAQRPRGLIGGFLPASGVDRAIG